MCKSLSIMLVVMVLAFASPRPARAGTVFGDCPPPPGSVPFHPIDCRLKALLNTTQATVPRGALWAALDHASGQASERLFTASAYCSSRRTNVARRHLRRATTQLARYVALLVGSAAQKIPADARNAMLIEAVSIRDEVFALRASLACPDDANDA